MITLRAHDNQPRPPDRLRVERTAAGRPVLVTAVAWWPDGYHVHDAASRRPLTVGIGVEGHAHCTCRPRVTTTLDAPPQCRHAALVRAFQADPARVLMAAARDHWMLDEAWRPDPTVRAHWAVQVKRAADDADAADHTRTARLRDIHHDLTRPPETPEEQEARLLEIFAPRSFAPR